MVKFFEMVIMFLFLAALFVSTSAAEGDIYKFTSDDGVVSFTNAPMPKGSQVFVKEPKLLQAPNKAEGKPPAKRESFHQLAEDKARQHNIDPELVKAVIKAESNWNPVAVSPKGARGLMQLMPTTAYDMGVGNAFDPEENIDGGVRYLKYLLEKFNGNLTLALAAYNAGPKRVEKTNTVPSIPETVSYVRRVMNDYSGRGGSTIAFDGAAKAVRAGIRKVVLEDGTLLFTNSYSAHAHFTN